MTASSPVTKIPQTSHSCSLVLSMSSRDVISFNAPVGGGLTVRSVEFTASQKDCECELLERF